MQLKVVLLPEPFGPIRPRISPSLTSNETFETAVKPPNVLVRPETVQERHLARARAGEDGREPRCGSPDAVATQRA